MSISDQYAAGLFDGEGCVSVIRTSRHGQFYYHLDVRIIGCYRPILDAFASEFGGRTWSQEGGSTKYSKPHTTWYISGEYAYSFLKRIQPFCHEKREQVDEAIRYFESLKALPYRDRNGKQALGQEFRDRLHILKDRSNSVRLDPVEDVVFV